MILNHDENKSFSTNKSGFETTTKGKNFLEPLDKKKRKLIIINNEFKSLALNEEKARDLIKWFDAFNLDTASRELRETKAKINAKNESLLEIKVERSKTKSKLKLIGEQIYPWYYPGRYFEKDQIELRKKVKALKEHSRKCTKRIGRAETIIQRLTDNSNRITSEINTYQLFDRSRERDNLHNIQFKKRDLESKKFFLEKDITRLEEKICQHMKQHQKLVSELENNERKLNKAKEFDQSLTDADNSYERRIIHEECESELGESKPKRLIDYSKKRIDILRRDINKLEIRINNILIRTERKIRHLIIDGNNICYENENFIGLQALSPLVEYLSSKYDVTVCFDNSIYKNLRINEISLKSKLGKAKNIHISPAKSDADEWILKLAENNPYTFIVSKDRFSEYYDQEAVISGRILRFEIIDGSFVSLDLDIDMR